MNPPSETNLQSIEQLPHIQENNKQSMQIDNNYNHNSPSRLKLIKVEFYDVSRESPVKATIEVENKIRKPSVNKLKRDSLIKQDDSRADWGWTNEYRKQNNNIESNLKEEGQLMEEPISNSTDSNNNNKELKLEGKKIGITRPRSKSLFIPSNSSESGFKVPKTPPPTPLEYSNNNNSINSSKQRRWSIADHPEELNKALQKLVKQQADHGHHHHHHHAPAHKKKVNANKFYSIQQEFSDQQLTNQRRRRASNPLIPTPLPSPRIRDVIAADSSLVKSDDLLLNEFDTEMDSAPINYSPTNYGTFASNQTQGKHSSHSIVCEGKLVLSGSLIPLEVNLEEREKLLLGSEVPSNPANSPTHFTHQALKQHKIWNRATVKEVQEKLKNISFNRELNRNDNSEHNRSREMEEEEEKEEINFSNSNAARHITIHSAQIPLDEVELKRHRELQEERNFSIFSPSSSSASSTNNINLTRPTFSAALKSLPNIRSEEDRSRESEHKQVIQTLPINKLSPRDKRIELNRRYSLPIGPLTDIIKLKSNKNSHSSQSKSAPTSHRNSLVLGSDYISPDQSKLLNLHIGPTKGKEAKLKHEILERRKSILNDYSVHLNRSIKEQRLYHKQDLATIHREFHHKKNNKRENRMDDLIYESWLQEFVPDFTSERDRVLKLVNKVKQETKHSKPQ